MNCFHTGQFDPLRYAMEDRLHQQHRSRLFSHCEPIIQAVPPRAASPASSPARNIYYIWRLAPPLQAALKAGAHGAFLSGAGPTVGA